MEGLIRFGVSFPEGLLERFDGCIKAMGYRSRSEALRDLTRDLIQDQELARRGEEVDVIGTITFSYDHSAAEVRDHLMDLQHRTMDKVISTTHIHMDHDRCLEVLIVKGPYGELKGFSDRIGALKGVTQGKLVVAELGPTDHHRGHPHRHRGGAVSSNPDHP